MNGEYRGELHCLGPDQYVLTGSFAVNGAANPTTANSRGREFGFTFTVSYAATGIYTVTLPSNLGVPSQPRAIIVSPQHDALADWFDVAVIGETTLNASGRQFVIQAHRSGIANAPAAAAGSRINFAIFVSNTTGK